MSYAYKLNEFVENPTKSLHSLQRFKTKHNHNDKPTSTYGA